MSERKVGSVTYKEVDEGYFQQRGLRRHAAFWSLWSLGVAAVISGDFYGWNAGLGVGGFGGLLIATIVVAIMYYGLCFCIAEMSPALPHTGGAYSFARSAMGPWGGFVTGLAENMEYVITPAVVVGAMGFLMHDVMQGLLNITGEPWWNSYVWWTLVFYVVFVAINIIGIEATMRFTVIINIAAIAILVFFGVAAIVSGDVDFGTLTNIEELPLAAEESHDPKRDIPRATLWGMTTLVFTGAIVLFLNTGLVGATPLGDSATPLFDGFTVIFGEGTSAELLGLAGMIGLIASFFTIIYAYGRNTYSLSRAGYFPKWLSITHPTRRTPHVALIAGAVVGYLLSLLIYELGKSESATAGQIVGALLYMAVFGAVISYAMQCLSFIMLRSKMPNIERPYRSPVGVVGAAIAGIIAVVSLISLYSNEDYRPAVYGTLVYFLLGILYFAIVGRHRLVLSPEEEFALTAGERGDPAAEGFSTSAAEQESILRGEGGGGGSSPSGSPPS
jgi:ethanolamine permease